MARSADHQQQQQRPLSFEHRRNSGYHSHQQQNYYQYYYPQPKQLTIASFLQKELLPDNSDAGSQQNGSATPTGNANNNGTSNGNGSVGVNSNNLRPQNSHQSVGSDYPSQRCRNSHYAQYQQYQHHHNPQHHHPHQYGMNSSHFRRKHADGHGQNCNINKKAPGTHGIQVECPKFKIKTLRLKEWAGWSTHKMQSKKYDYETYLY